jgi:AraC-like DNA-binding protein
VFNRVEESVQGCGQLAFLTCPDKKANFIHWVCSEQKPVSLKIYIKNMVSIRCQMVVKAELKELGVQYSEVKIGEANIIGDLDPEQLKQLDDALRKSGLQLMDNKKSILVEKIKSAIIELVHYTDDQIKVNLSDFLSEKINYDYTYLANLFSEVKGITIEKFYLAHKIEKVKELIVYDELNLTEIAYKMHYSSVAHLSNQFKKMTGLTPSHFKKLKDKRRETLENV